jgi:cytidylate kinase
MREMDDQADLTEVEEAIVKRDEWDSSRAHSPLKKAADALLVDTTDLTIDEQVNVIIEKIIDYLETNARQGSVR